MSDGKFEDWFSISGQESGIKERRLEKMIKASFRGIFKCDTGAINGGRHDPGIDWRLCRGPCPTDDRAQSVRGLHPNSRRRIAARRGEAEPIERLCREGDSSTLHAIDNVRCRGTNSRRSRRSRAQDFEEPSTREAEAAARYECQRKPAHERAWLRKELALQAILRCR